MERGRRDAAAIAAGRHAAVIAAAAGQAAWYHEIVVVTRADLEVQLRRVAAAVTDPACGIHGPGSAAWRINRESIVFLGGGRAALLQLAHPYVAHGVDQHSRTRQDAAGRFQRTFDAVWAMVFGPLDQALAAARRVHAIHDRVRGAIAEDVGAYARGHAYCANDLGALTWVFATLVHTAVGVYELVVGPLGAAERERYYADSARLAALFGIPAEALPAGWDAFAAYFDAMVASDAIAVGAPARALCGFLLRAPEPALAPAWRWYATMTAGLLPDRVRVAYGLPLSAAGRAVFAASARALRAVYPALPRSIRYVPAYVQQRRRRAGLGPSRVSDAMARLLVVGVGGRAAARRRGRVTSRARRPAAGTPACTRRDRS